MKDINASPNYVAETGIGTPNRKITNITLPGGVVSIYYLRAIVGCFADGQLADRIDSINGLFYASMFALVGGALQAATQSSISFSWLAL